MLEVAGEAIIKKVIEAAAKAIENKVDLSGIDTMKLDKSESKAAIEHHVNMISRWASEISFRDLRRAKGLSDAFVDLDLTLGRIPARNPSCIARRMKTTDLLQYSGNAVILGDPGAGKTTSLKRLALSVLAGTPGSGKGKTPLLIRLRDLTNRSIVSEVLDILGVRTSFADEPAKEIRERALFRIVGQYLSNLNALLLIDGLDEVAFRERERIVKDLRDLLLQAKGYQVIITCRTADFVYSFENCALFAIESLSSSQIRDFACKWLGEKAGEDLLAKIGSTPYGGSEVLPLTLAHLCAIYERYGSIPEKPKTVYRKIVRLLLEEWDEQRSVKRQSRYAAFDVDRKEDFLKAMALRLTLISNQTSFNHRQLEMAYCDIYDRFDLPRDEARKVAQELELHTGLIVETGFENYEFAHKSIQEYLSAEYILKLPTIPSDWTLQLPNEMALAVALSSDSNEYFTAAVESAVNRSRGTLENFTYPFLRRVILEKVDFRPALSLGCSIVHLYSETYFPSRGQLRLPFGSGFDVFSDFLNQPPVQESVRLIMQQASLRGIGDICLLSLKDANDIEANLSLPTVGHYTVDDRFLELIGEK